MLTSIVLVSAAAQLAVSVLVLVARGARAASAAVYALSAVICLAPLIALVAGASWSEVTLPLGLPWIGAHFSIDPLSAFFLIVVNLGGAVTGLYAVGYGSHESAPHRVLPFYPAFLAGMNLVVVASDAFSFLLSWEFMSLSSWALVMAHHRERDNAFAGYVYLVMASAGTLALLLAYGLLAGAGGDYTFEAIRQNHLTPLFATLVLVLALIGAGSKAGIVPLHVWLPLAHPAAPSHVSALMSGVMTKVAVYGFIRIVFDLMGPGQWWWATIVLVLGAITAVMGVLYALMQHDLKRLLAYHTVENIGIIFIGLGLALAFRANGMALAAAVALSAALFHVLNHSLFKGLLFLGSGAVLGATGERDMEHLGGLIHRMPSTAFLFLAGCVAISALPPLNGFVSEWLTFQAILLTPALPHWDLRIIAPAAGVMLALSAALAAACFVKAFGVTFLGRPRSPAAQNARETDSYSIAAMGVLAVFCLLAGIFPGVVMDGLAPVTQALVGGRMPAQNSIAWLSIVPVDPGRSSYNGLLVFLFIAASATLAAVGIHGLASRALRRAPPWDCGFPEPSPATQYTAASFAQPIRRVYGSVVFRAREHVQMPPPGSVAPAHFAATLRDLIWEEFYVPIAGGVGMVADRLNRFQFLTVRRYLALVFSALVILLAAVALWP